MDAGGMKSNSDNNPAFVNRKTDLKRLPTRIQFNIGAIKKPKLNENDSTSVPATSNIFQQRQMLPVYQHRKR